MGFHLVYHGANLHELAQVHQTVGEEVGDPNGPDLPSLVGLFHGPPGAIVVVEGLVDEQQVHVIRAQLAQGLVNGSLRLFIPAVGNPHLRGEEQFLARHPALLRRAAYGLLIAVNLGRINGTVAGADRVQHAALALCGIRYLKTPKPGWA